MIKLTLYLFIFIFINSAYAITSQEITADCKKVKDFATLGEKLYRQKKYSAARDQFEQQVMWSEFCNTRMDGDENYDEATAYNNVALTYLHEGEFLKANAWLQLEPEDSKSVYNFSKYRAEIEQAQQESLTTVTGTYWLYEGLSIWSTINIRKQKGKYEFSFSGSAITRMTPYYGPNLGNLSKTIKIKGRQELVKINASRVGSCKYTLSFNNQGIKIKRIEGDISECGFGDRVVMEGKYIKVSNIPVVKSEYE